MIINKGLKGALAVGFAMTVAGCTALPSSGPSRQDVVGNATVKNSLDDKKSRFQYALLDINSSVLPYFDYSRYDSLYNGFGMGNSKPSTDLGVGDVIQITVFEAQAGGLFIPAGATTTQGNYVTLPKQTIDAKGEIGRAHV